LYRRFILDGLVRLHKAGKLRFFGDHANLVDMTAFTEFLAPLRKIDWVVYAKEPFAGPKAVLTYLSRYTHRVAISNSRLIRADADHVTFRVKDYRVKGSGRHTTMTLATAEFIRRFLIHVLPRGQHRIRHYGFFGNHCPAGFAKQMPRGATVQPISLRSGNCSGLKRQVKITPTPPGAPMTNPAHSQSPVHAAAGD
jgi:hypothetical protein